MRAWVTLRVIVVLLGLMTLTAVGVVLLTGCGAGGNTDAPVPQAAETGQITVRIAWPEAQSESRLVMTTCESIKIIVSADDLSSPITTTINAPTTSATLTVPAGSNRVVDAEGYDAADAGGTQIQKTCHTETIPEVITGGTYPVVVYLVDMWDPGDDTAAGATPIATDGTPSPLHLIHGWWGSPPPLWKDQLDYFTFSATAGDFYTVETIDLTSYVSEGQWRLEIYDTDGTTLLASGAWHTTVPAVLTWQAPADGTYFVCVYGTPAGSQPKMYIEYRLTISSGGTGDIDVGVD